MANVNPYHVRLAISQYGDQFRAELFTEDLGDTEGKELFPSLRKLRIEEQEFEVWLDSLAGGQVTFDAEQLRQIGQLLFKYLLGSDENREKWKDICAQAERQGRAIRLLIDATTPDVYDLPYGLVCAQDGKFLFQPESDRLAIQFVRILRQSTPRPLQLARRPLRLLVVAAEPKGLEVGCAHHLCQFLQGLGDAYAVTLGDANGAYPLPEVVAGPPDAWQPEHFTRFCRITRDVLKRALKDGAYDLLHVIAHGVGTGLLVCNADGTRAEVTSGDFGNWCRASQIQLAFLQVCKSGQAGDRGAFGGIAQKLVSPQFGNLAAVVASPYPIDPAQSTQVAIQFYQRLVRAESQSPDVALLQSFPEDEGDWRLWALLELWVRPHTLASTSTRGFFQFPSPYRGLSRFEERDWEIFSGRTAETRDLLKIVSAESVVAVVGDSGSGKSSLLQAGVCAQVRFNGLRDRKDWRIVSLTPGKTPGQNLLRSLGGQANDPSWEAALRQAFAKGWQTAQPLLLVFDQFEELFTLCDTPAERLTVSTILAEEVKQHPDQFHLMLGMRSEYQGAAVALPGMGDLIRRPWVLTPPNADNIQAIIEKPATTYGYTFEDGLLKTIQADPLLTTGVIPLPLLEFALERLWLKAVEDGSQAFTLADYQSLGGLEGAIAKHADKVYDDLPTNFSKCGPASQRVAEQIMTGLVTTSGTRHTRHPRPRRGLEAKTDNPELARQVIDELVGERLLTLRHNPNQPDDALVDLTHEVLLTRWVKLQQWLALDPKGRKMKEAFQKVIETWHSNQMLPDANAARGFLAWMKTSNLHASPEEDEFVAKLETIVREDEARYQREVEARQQAEKQTLLAQEKEAEARKQQQEANRRTMLSLAQTLNFQALDQLARHNVVRAALLARQAYLFHQQYQGQMLAQMDNTLRQVLEAFVFQSRVFNHPGSVYAVAFSPNGTCFASGSADQTVRVWDLTQPQAAPRVLEGHTDFVMCVAFSPDGARLASGSADQMVILWDLRQPQAMPRILEGHKDFVMSVAFSPDGAYLASGSADQNVGVWDLTRPDTIPSVLTVFKGDSAVNSVAFSPDGTHLASGSSDKTVRIWKLTQSDAAPRILAGHGSAVTSVAFSPDGGRLASGSRDKLVRVWNLTIPPGEEIAVVPSVLAGHDDIVMSVAFSPDGTHLVSGSADMTLRLWDLRQPAVVPSVLAGHEQYVASVAFSPDGTHLLSGSDDNTVRVWDLTQSVATCDIFTRHDAAVMSVAFNHSRTLLASGGADKTVRVWDLTRPNVAPLVLTGHEEPVLSVVFNPNRTLLASVGADKTVRVWDLTRPDVAPLVLTGHEEPVLSMAFSPDGIRLASVSRNRTVRVWYLNHPSTAPTVLGGYLDNSSSVTFSPDGTRLASCCEDWTVQVWDLNQPSAAPHVLGQEGKVFSVAFSPDGTRLASVSSDKVWVWDLTQPTAAPCILAGHDNPVLSVAFSPDGTCLASGSQDKTVRVWDLSQPSVAPRIFAGHGESVSTVAFSPDGTRLASGSKDMTIRVWRIRTEELATQICEQVGRNLSWEEWQQFVSPDIPYERTCSNHPVHPSVQEAAPNLAQAGNIGLPKTMQKGESPFTPEVSGQLRQLANVKSYDGGLHPNPYHFRLTISQYGEGFRAELFTENLGDTEGILLSSIRKRIVGKPKEGDAAMFDQLIEVLASGYADFDSTQLRNIGSILFKYFLGSKENFAKWREICTQAEREGRGIRLLIDAITSDVYDLPYGLLYDEHGKFLFRPGQNYIPIQFVRILRQSTPRLLQLTRRPLRLLVVAAEPKGLDVGCARYLCELLRGLGDAYSVTLCTADGIASLAELVSGPPETWQPEAFARVCRTTRTALKRAFKESEYDLLHVMLPGTGEGLLMCAADGTREDVTSGDFAGWCRASQIQLAFLQVCKGGQVWERGRGAFGGIAQKLMNPHFGNLAAVVAASYPINLARTTQVAIRFYLDLLGGVSPDVALWRSFPEREGAWRSWALLELWVRPGVLASSGTRGTFQFPRPYRGLARFEEQDAEIFFGRDAETMELLNILTTESIVTVVGDSGSGKSSLLQAGVYARVRRNGLLAREDWRIITLTPGATPAMNLLLAIGGQATDQSWEAALRETFAQVWQRTQPLLLVLDQFEELFTLCNDPAQRLFVSTVLAEEVQQHPDRFRLLLGMQSPYLGAAATLPGLNTLIARPWILKPPDAHNIYAIIARPAAYHGYTFEDGLLDRMLNDLLLTTGTAAAPLPLLEFALERLWLKAVERGSQEFTQADYEALGRLEGAIARHADDVYDYLAERPDLGPSAQHLAEQIFTGLVSAQNTRLPRPRRELEAETGAPELACKVIDRLVGERLLTLRRNPNTPDDALVDLAHEILITRWERLQQWLALDPDGRAMKEAFPKDLERWTQGLPNMPARSPQLLPNAKVAAAYLAWIDSRQIILTEAQQVFVSELRKKVTSK